MAIALFGGILVLALAVLLAGTALSLQRLRTRLVAQDAQLAALERDLQGVCLGARGMGDAVFRLEQRLRRLHERQDHMDLRESDHRVYHQAIGLVRRGAGVEELVATCGLSRSEAELLHLLHCQSEEPPARRRAAG